MTYWEDRQTAGALLAALLAERDEQDRRAAEIGAVVVDPGEYVSNDSFELYNDAVHAGQHPAGLLVALVHLVLDLAPEIRERTRYLRREIAAAAANALAEENDPP